MRSKHCTVLVLVINFKCYPLILDIVTSYFLLLSTISLWVKVKVSQKVLLNALSCKSAEQNSLFALYLRKIFSRLDTL